MKILNKFCCLITALNLALSLASYLIPPSFAANDLKKPLQGQVRKRHKVIRPVKAKAANSYAIYRPFNPNNPPPIDNKIHPVSSNTR